MAEHYAAEALKYAPNDPQATKIMNDSRAALAPPKVDVPAKKDPVPKIDPAAQMNQWVRAAQASETQGRYPDAHAFANADQAEARRLTGLLKQRSELTTRPKGEPQRTADKSGDARAAGQRKLTEEIRQQIEVINRAAPRKANGRDDNSNTQFAVLALWVARRYGIPADGSLLIGDQMNRIRLWRTGLDQNAR